MLKNRRKVVCFLHLLKNLVISFSWKHSKVKKWYCYSYFATNQLLEKTLVLGLYAKMLTANQIAGFFSVLPQERSEGSSWFFAFRYFIEDSYKFMLLFMVCIPRHAQNAWNNKFAVSLQNFKKEERGKFDFLHENKRQSFLQADTFHL